MIVLDHISITYSTGVEALEDVSIRIEKGEFAFIVGQSGSGKSTLIKLLLKELNPTEGKLYVGGRQVTKLTRKQIQRYRRNIGVVFQDFLLLKDRTVYENVAFAQQVLNISRKDTMKNAANVLAMVGLTDKMDVYPQHLSGGEQQRVAIARALVNHPTILLADEPTGNLDPANAWGIMSLLDEVNRQGTTVIVVTHNEDVVNIMQKRVITLQSGFVVRDEMKSGYTSFHEMTKGSIL
ncbi:MAG: cell division ATP-binding protein FtsE [Lachnoclostridium sp.]|nr:cell division ATP-binding protein FtsE [Lachnoclostridium sp.]